MAMWVAGFWKICLLASLQGDHIKLCFINYLLLRLGSNQEPKKGVLFAKMLGHFDI